MPVEERQPLVIYHRNCADGFCAAWIAHKKLGDNCEYIGYQYGGATPPDVKDRRVWILDFSFKRELMTRLIDEALQITVLDHHFTAEEELRGLETDFYYQPQAPKIVFDMQRSGGRLTWEHFFPDAKAPWLVEYTEDRDLWRHNLTNSHEVNANLRSYPYSFQVWNELDEKLMPGTPEWQTFVTAGAAIRRWERQTIDMHVKQAQEVEMGGHTVLAVNATVLFSEIGHELARGRPFGACWFMRRDGRRQWSLRSHDDGLDVAQIAKKFGGGGHKHAAGFEEVVTCTSS